MKSPYEILGNLRQKIVSQTARKVQFDKIVESAFMAELPCDYDGTGKETYVKVDVVSRIRQNGEQLKRIAAKQSVLGLTCKNKHRFEKKSTLKQPQKCYLCAKTIKCSQNEAIADAEPVPEQQSEDFYTCEQECAFCCLACQRVDDFNYNTSYTDGQTHLELDGDNWDDDGQERQPSETEIFFGPRSLISIFQRKTDYQNIVLKEAEVPFELPAQELYFSHSRDALYSKLSNDGSNRMIVVYLRDLAWRIFRCPDVVKGLGWHAKNSVSLICNNRVPAYYDKNSKDKMTDLVGTFKLFDLHTQTEILAVSNTLNMFFDSPQVEPLCKTEKQQDVTYEVETHPLLRGCIHKLKDVIDNGLQNDRMPLDLGFTIRAMQEGTGDQQGIGASSWVVWNGKNNAESFKKLKMHLQTTSDSWDDCFKWLKDKTKEVSNRFFRHAYSPSSWNSREKVLVVWYWADKKQEDIDIQLDLIEPRRWDATIKSIKSHCHEKLKGRKIIDVKMLHDYWSGKPLVSVVSIPDQNCNGVLELNLQEEISGDTEFMLELICKQIKRTIQFVGTSFCPSYLWWGSEKHIISAEFHSFSANAKRSGQLEHFSDEATPVNFDHHKKILLVRPRFIEASVLVFDPSEKPESDSYQFCFYEFKSLKELTGEPNFNNEIKEWQLNELIQKQDKSGDLTVLDKRVLQLQANAALDRVLYVHKTKGLIKGMQRRKEDKGDVFEYLAFPKYSELIPITRGWGFLSNNPVVRLKRSSGQEALIRMFDGPTEFFHPSDGWILSTLDRDPEKLVAVVAHWQTDKGLSIVSLPDLKAGLVDTKVGNEAQQAVTLLAMELKHRQHIEFPCALSTFANGFTLTSFVKTQMQVQVKFQQEFFEFVRYQHSDQIDGYTNYASSLIAYLTRDNRMSCISCLQAQDLKEIKAKSRSDEKQPDSEDKQDQACSGTMRLHVLAFDAYADKPSYKLTTIYEFCETKIKPPCKVSSKIKSVTAFGEMKQLCFQYEDSLVFVDCRGKEIKVKCYPIADEKGSENSAQNVGSAGREGNKTRLSEKVKIMEVVPIPVVIGTDENPYFIVKEGEMSTSTKIKRGVNFYNEDKPVFEDVFSINSDKVYFFTRQSVQVGGDDSNQKDEFLLMDGSHKIKVLYQLGEKLVQFKTIELFANDLSQIDEQPFSMVSVSRGVLHCGSKVFRLLNTPNSRREATWACYDLRESIDRDIRELVYVSGTGNICLVKRTRDELESYLIPHADASYLDCLPVPKNGKSQSNFCTFVNSDSNFIVEQMVAENQRRFLLFKTNGQLLGTVGFKPFKTIMNAQDDQTEEINAEASKANLKITSLKLVTCSQSKKFFVFKNDKEYLVFELVSESTLQKRKEDADREKEESQMNQSGLINTGKQSRRACCLSSKLYPEKETVSEPKQQLADKVQKDSQKPASTAEVKRDVNHNSLWFQQLEFQRSDPFGPPLQDENVTILDDEKPQFIRVQIVEDKVEDGNEVQKAPLLKKCSSFSLRRCILVCLNPEQMQNFLEAAQVLAQRNQGNQEGDSLTTGRTLRDNLNLIQEIPEEQSKSFIQDTHAPALMLHWWRNKQQTEDTQTIEFKFMTESSLPNDRIMAQERAKPDFMSQCGRYLIVKKGSEIFVFMPPSEYDPDPTVINQAVKLKLELKEDSQLFAVYPTDMKGIVQFHLQLKDKPAGVISWDVVNDEQFNQFEAFDKSDYNQLHRVVKTVSEYKETKVVKELEEYAPRVKQEQDFDKGQQCGCYLDGEALIELEYNKPVQLFNKNRQTSMSPDNEQDQTNLKNEARVSPSYDFFLSFRQPGRLHYFVNDFDLVYWQRYLANESHELNQEEGTITRLSPFRLFNEKTPVLHNFFDQEMARENLREDKRTVFKLFLAALQAKFDSKKIVTRNVQFASFFLRYSANISSPMSQAYEKNRIEELLQMIDLLSLKKDFQMLNWLFRRTYTDIELRSVVFKEIIARAIKQGGETPKPIMLPWGGSKDQYLISHSSSIEFKNDLQKFSIDPPEKESTNIINRLTRMVMKVCGFLFNAVKAVKTAITKVVRSLVVVVVGWFIKDPRYRLRATKTGLEYGPEIKQITRQDKKQGKAEDDASEKLPIRRVQATFYDFSVLLDQNAEQLLQILAHSKDEVFDIQQVQAIIGYLWDSYFDKIFDNCFMPFICEFLSWHLLTLVFVYDADDLRGGFNYKYFNQLFWLYVFGKCYLSLFAVELIQLRKSGIEYFSDYWNWIDIISQQMVTVHMILHQLYEVRNSQMNVLAAFTSLLLWVKLFYWLRMFSGYGAFVRILQQIVADIRIFLIMLLICVAAFATSTFIFNQNRIETDDKSSLYLAAFEWSPADAMLNSWLTGLGDFSYDNNSNENAVPIWIVFILATIIIQLVFLNLLIAIMSDSFTKIYANMERAYVKEKCLMILDHFWILNISETFNKKRYVLWLKATEETAEEGQIQMTQAKIQDVQDTVVNMQTKLESTQNSIINLGELNQTQIKNTQLEVQQNATELFQLRTDLLTQSKLISRLQTGQQIMHDELKDELAAIKKMLTKQ